MRVWPPPDGATLPTGAPSRAPTPTRRAGASPPMRACSTRPYARSRPRASAAVAVLPRQSRWAGTGHGAAQRGLQPPRDRLPQSPRAAARRRSPGEPRHLQAHLDRYIAHPETFLAGPATTVTPDPDRRLYSRAEFVRLAPRRACRTDTAHCGGDTGDDAANYVDDRFPPLRLIALDTVNPGGNYHGSIGAAQLAWLEERLAEVHARYWDARGGAIVTGNEDRLVVLMSHHGLASLSNDRVAAESENDLPRILGPALESVLHRFPNVILWMNGHTHRNTVRPAARSGGPVSRLLGGNDRIADWLALPGPPCRDRRQRQRRPLRFCTMVDHAAPPDPPPPPGSSARRDPPATGR